MAKKETKVDAVEEVRTVPAPPAEEPDYGNAEIPTGEATIDADFNVDDEYKPEPLVPQGVYHAAVTGVTFEPGQQAIAWKLCLHDNGGVMSDGETPVDGAVVMFRNWLPKPGDEAELTANGRSTKRQSKINMLKQFSENLDIDMSTPTAILSALQNQEWVGLEVNVQISTREYEGKIYNDVKKVVPSTL